MKHCEKALMEEKYMYERKVMHAKVKGYIQGLRWTGIKELLFELSVVYRVDLKILNEDKGLLRTTIFYQIEGDEQDVRKFGQELRKATEKYNKE